VSQTTTPKKVKAIIETTFYPPVPGPNANHTTNIEIKGNCPPPNAQCRVIGLVRDHFVIATFVWDNMTGDFTLTIPGGLLWDDNLYVVSIWSDDAAASGGIFIDTRPPGV